MDRLRSALTNRFYQWYGRQTVDLSQFELSPTEISEITDIGEYDEDSALPALYNLYLFDVSH